MLAGLSATKVRFAGEPVYNYLTEADYDLSYNFTGVLAFDVILPRNQAKWSLCNELMYSSYETNGVYSKQHNPNWRTTQFTYFSYSYLKLNNLVGF